MPWKPYGVREKTELKPGFRDIWLTLRHIQNMVGGMNTTLANAAFTTTRTDGRMEHLADELNTVTGRLEDTSTRLATMTSRLADLGIRERLSDHGGGSCPLCGCKVPARRP